MSGAPEGLREVVEGVFGERGVAMLENQTIFLATLGKNRAKVPKEGNNDAPEVHLRGDASPFVAIHEFAHIHHFLSFPELTRSAPEYRCEACALLAEERAIPYIKDEPKTLQRRLDLLAASAKSDDLQHSMRIANRVSDLTPMLDAVGFILRGGYDD